jgi:hypothetical protein
MLVADLVDEIWWFKSRGKLGSQGLDLNFDEEKLITHGFIASDIYSLGADRLTIFMKA